MLLSVVSCSDDICAYDEDMNFDCEDLQLNLGDLCDSNNDGTLDGFITDTCQCLSENVDFDCEELQLNFGDACDSNGDGTLDGIITDECGCLTESVDFDCEELQLNFGDACDSNGDGALDGTITDACDCLTESADFDCEDLQLNFEVACDSDNDGVNDGTVSENCECTPGFPVITSCPGFIQNGDFEIITGDPNAFIDEDIDLATDWKALWQSSDSLADLFDDTTTYFGTGCFTAPTPSSGVFAGMWIENSTDPNRSPDFREGMFNELTVTINQNSGLYNLSFDYANMSEACSASNDVKVGVYGVYHPNANPLPASPTGISTPTNLDLFGASNTVFLGEVVITSTTTNAWQTATFSIDTSALTFPTNGINHIMITNSHLPFDDYGKMYLGFDNFCLIN